MVLHRQNMQKDSSESGGIRVDEAEKEWESIWVAPDQIAADLVKGLLATASIPVQTAGGALGQIYGVRVGPMAEVELLVPAEQADQAREILSQEMSGEVLVSKGISSLEGEKVCRQIDAMRDEIIAFLQDLVRAESINPPGDTTRPAAVIQEKFASCGVECELVAVDGNNPSVIARINPGQKPELLFNSHIDTVLVGDPAQWRHDPFGGEIVDGRLYGRGAADAKGSVAAMVMAAKALVLSGVELSGTLVVNPVSDEEVGGAKGAQHLLTAGYLDPDYAVIGEITTNRVAVAEKGAIWVTLTTIGRSAHASTPWDGINAIDKMMTVLAGVKQMAGERFAGQKHPLTPPPSMNIGTIHGGVKTNMVADRCEVVIDLRPIPGMDAGELAQAVEATVAALREQDPDLQVLVESRILATPFETDPEELIVQFVQAACNTMGLPEEVVGYQQVSDGRFFADAGIPTVILGPGGASVAHTPNESIGVEEIIQATKLYALIALNTLSGQ